LGGADPVLVTKIEGAREAAYDEALAALNSPRFRGAMIDLVGWIALGEWRRQAAADEPLAAFAAGALDRFWRKVKKGGRGLASIGDEARHEVRIAGKKLRYAAEFFASLHTGKKVAKRRAAFLGPLEKLQGDLGDLNDMATAVELSESLNRRLALPPQELAERRDVKDKDALLAAAERAHAQLVEAGPYWR
jgi:CHAD domain-containing protein